MRPQTFKIVCAALCTVPLMVTNGWARLPKPIETSGVVLAIDHQTHTLVLKTATDSKPLLLDWNTDTRFMKDGRSTNADALQARTSVRVSYKHISFRNPLLKTVVWQNRKQQAKQQ